MKTIILSCTVLLVLSSSLFANPVGYWRFDELSASPGAALNPVSSVNDASLNATTSGTPIYSSDVPGPRILDPLSGSIVDNAFSLDGTAASSRVNVANHALLNASTDFTVEFFLRLNGEPASYESFVQRIDTTHNTGAGGPGRNYRRWQVDFDHGNNLTSGFGEARSRFDTYDPSLVITDPIEGQTDYNRVAHGNHLFIDTDTGSNDINDYTAGDPSTQGDGLNDDPATWHHLAVTVSNNVVSLFMDYAPAAGSQLTLAGTFVHPDGQLRFGKLSSGTHGLFMDELRYSDSVLTPEQFLVAIPEPAVPALVLFGAMLLQFIHQRRNCA
jgi:hypothetical protein